MSNQLRKGIERLRQYYINRLLKSGNYQDSAHELSTLTLTELEEIVKKTFPQQK